MPTSEEIKAGRPYTTANCFCMDHGEALARGATEYIEQKYEQVRMGEPRAVSEYGTPYEQVVLFASALEGLATIKNFFKDNIDEWLREHGHSILVWRIKPDVSAEPVDFERGNVDPVKIKLRFRAHTL